MSGTGELWAEIVSFSACFWLLVFMFVSVRIQLFIVRRYQQETGLLDTVCFSEHAIFTRALPGFLSSSIYVAHLLSLVWFWDYCKKKKTYRDLKSPQDVTQYFTKKEIRYVKWFAYGGLILFFHAIAILSVYCLWPHAFD